MSNVKESVRQQFGSVAEGYRTSAVHAAGQDLCRLVEAASLTGRERVLDAGCGAGHATLALAPFAAEVVALDLTSAMLEQTRRLAAERGVKNIVTCLGDVEELPYGDGTFDVAVSRYSAHHWPRPAAALGELRRVLRPGGSLLLGDVVSPEEAALDTFLQTVELLRDPSHVRDHSVSQWLRMLSEAGFSPRVDLTWSLALEFVPWVERTATPKARVAVIESLLDGAPQGVKAAFGVQVDRTFSVPGALFVGRRS